MQEKDNSDSKTGGSAPHDYEDRGTEPNRNFILLFTQVVAIKIRHILKARNQ